MRNELGQASLLAFILSLLLAGTTFFVGYGDPAPTSNRMVATSAAWRLRLWLLPLWPARSLDFAWES
jgi:hypothetical protein